MKLYLRKPSPAMLVACIALFVGLSGAGTAAVVVLKKNQVRSIHIGDGQVKKVDLGANAVDSTKVGDGALLAQDFAAGQLPAGAQGQQGAKGDPGERGPAGAEGRGFTWRGEWSGDETYGEGDVVSHVGSAWVGTADNRDVEPSNDCRAECAWELMAAKGDAGLQGNPGTPFSGTFASPNGQYTIAVTDTGITASGPGGSVRIGPTAVELLGSSGGSVRVLPASTAIQGALVTLNGCTKPVARLGDPIAGSFAGSFDLSGENSSILVPTPIFVRIDQVLFSGADTPTYAEVPTSFAGVTGSVSGSVSAGSATVCAG